MTARNVEQTRIPANPIDVLSQQLVAQVVSGDSNADDLYGLVRRAAPYSELSRAVFDETLDMLAGRYPSDLFSELRPRLNWDRATGEALHNAIVWQDRRTASIWWLLPLAMAVRAIGPRSSKRSARWTGRPFIAVRPRLWENCRSVKKH